MSSSPVIDKAVGILCDFDFCPFNIGTDNHSKCANCIKLALISEVITLTQSKPMCKKS